MDAARVRPGDNDPIQVLELPPGVRNACGRNGIRTVGQLVALSEAKFLQMRGGGPTRWQQLRMALAEYGFDAPPESTPDNDPILLACRPAERRPLPVHPDSEWPAVTWTRRSYGGAEWAFCAPERWVPIALDATAPVLDGRRLSMAITRKGREMFYATWSTRYPGRVDDQQSLPATAIEGPPGPGPQRVAWLGRQVLSMTGHEDPGLPALRRRRIAARRALATVAGYEPSQALNDSGLLPGGASLQLAGLNAYAARVLDEGGD